jgi:hypothetical protein
MRTLFLAILAGVLIYGLPGSASAQQYVSPMPTHVICPPGQVWNEDGGYCERARRGPGPVGPGVPPISGTVGGEPTVCGAGGSWTFCYAPILRRPPTK